MANQRIAGMLQFALDGVLYQASGDWTFNPGLPKVETMLSTTGVAGYTEKPQVPFIEGDLTITPDLDIQGVLSARAVTAYLTLGSGQVLALQDANQVGEGTGNAAEGKLPVRFEGSKMQVVS